VLQGGSPTHRRMAAGGSRQGSLQWDRLQAAIQLVASPAAGSTRPAGASPRAGGLAGASSGAAWQPLLRGASMDGVLQDDEVGTPLGV